MNNPNFIFSVTNIAVGLVFILLSIPLIANKIPMNRLYGFRIQKALTCDENWYKINQYGGQQLLFWSIVMVGIGVVGLLFPVEVQKNEIANGFRAVVPPVVCITVAIVKTVLYSKTLE